LRAVSARVHCGWRTFPSAKHSNRGFRCTWTAGCRQDAERALNSSASVEQKTRGECTHCRNIFCGRGQQDCQPSDVGLPFALFYRHWLHRSRASVLFLGSKFAASGYGLVRL
jgi:hypothetical protein